MYIHYVYTYIDIQYVYIHRPSFLGHTARRHRAPGRQVDLVPIEPLLTNITTMYRQYSYMV